MISEQEEAEFNAESRRYRAELARREKLAAEGDVDAIWAELTRPRPVPADTAEIFPLLVTAIEVRARRFPEEYAAETVARVVALTSYLCLRDHYLVTSQIALHDRSAQGRGRVELQPALADRVIPRLQALQASLCEILHAQASILRMHELARAKRIENDRAGGESPSKAIPKGKARARRKPQSAPAQGNGKYHENGKAGVNRIAGLLDGPGPKANGVHHDD